MSRRRQTSSQSGQSCRVLLRDRVTTLRLGHWGHATSAFSADVCTAFRPRWHYGEVGDAIWARDNLLGRQGTAARTHFPLGPRISAKQVLAAIVRQTRGV